MEQPPNVDIIRVICTGRVDPEGDDKPYKYPGMFSIVDVLMLNKVDLLPLLDFDLDYFRRGVEALNPDVAFFPISCKTGEGVQELIDWLIERCRVG